MAIDLNKEENQFELIPSGTRTVLRMGINPPDSASRCQSSPALTRSSQGDAEYLNCEFEIVSGLYKGRKVFQNLTVAGGKKDKDGKSIAARISGATLKAIWDAHLSLLPTDMSQEAVQKRMIKDYSEFHGVHFPATICIKEQDNGYKPRNELYHIITPDKPEYAKLMAGEEVEPLNIGIISKGGKKKTTSGAAPQETKPAWAQDNPSTPQQPDASGAIDPVKAAFPGVGVQPAAGNRPAWAR